MPSGVHRRNAPKSHHSSLTFERLAAGEVWKLPLMGPRDGFVHRSLYRTNHHYGIGYCLLNRRRS